MEQVLYWIVLIVCARDVTHKEKDHCFVFNCALNKALDKELSDKCEQWVTAGCLSFSSLHLSASENHSAPPDVTGYSSDSSHSHTERHHMANMGTIARNTQKYGNAERMETGDGKSLRCVKQLERLNKDADKNRNFLTRRWAQIGPPP